MICFGRFSPKTEDDIENSQFHPRTPTDALHAPAAISTLKDTVSREAGQRPNKQLIPIWTLSSCKFQAFAIISEIAASPSMSPLRYPPRQSKHSTACPSFVQPFKSQNVMFGHWSKFYRTSLGITGSQNTSFSTILSTLRRGGGNHVSGLPGEPLQSAHAT